MKLSIAFITANRKQELYRAILSCKENKNNLIADEDIEYIIVDNASTDGTEEHIKSSFDDLNIVYKYSKTNLGVAGGRNLAFKLAKGEYVFFLDDDAILASENFFDSFIKFMDANPDVVVASPDIQEPLTKTNLNCKNKYKKNEMTLILSFCGCAHILRRDFFKSNAFLYPNELKFGSEELYASLLAYANDKLIVEYDKIKVEHYPSVINRCQGDERKFNFIFNQYIIKKMIYPKQVILLTWTCYMLHRIKNNFWSIKWNKLAKKYYKERYDNKYALKMSMECWKNTIKRFGWKAVM